MAWDSRWDLEWVGVLAGKGTSVSCPSWDGLGVSQGQDALILRVYTCQVGIVLGLYTLDPDSYGVGGTYHFLSGRMRRPRC